MVVHHVTRTEKERQNVRTEYAQGNLDGLHYVRTLLAERVQAINESDQPESIEHWAGMRQEAEQWLSLLDMLIEVEGRESNEQ